MVKQKIQKILNHKVFYVLVISWTVFWVFLNLSFEKKSSLNVDETKFEGVLEKLVVNDTKASLTLNIGSENLVCNYYFKEDQAYSDFREKYILGSKLLLKGTLSEPSNNTVPNTFNYKKYLYYHNTFYTCNTKEIEIIDENVNIFYRIKNAVIKRIMKFYTRDYMYTMIIGDKSLLDKETFSDYRQNGVTHLFAISGMHIGLFVAFLLKLFKKVGEKRRYLIVISFIWFYAFLAGFSPSVIRSCLLFSLITFFKILKIEISSIKSLVITAFILICINPFIVMDIGFIYSFLTTIGLLYSGSILCKHKIIGTSLVAILYSLPVTINNFYKINLLSVFFNILFVPFVSIIVYPLCLLSFVFSFLEPLLRLSINILELLNSACTKISFLYIVIPKMSLILIIIYYLILIIFLKKKFYLVSFLLISVVLLSKFKPFLDDHDYVEFLDVGQGDSILIRSKKNKEIVLIDTGGIEVGKDKEVTYHVSSNTLTYLNSLGLNKIDTLILTHGDQDHLGDALYLINSLKVKEVMLNGGELNDKEKQILESGIKRIYEYKGNLKFRFWNDQDWGNENANSIVASLEIDDVNFLFMGDADKQTERYVLKKIKFSKIDILKLGHHGSKTSSDKTFLEKMQVKLGIISAGRNNRYGHPNRETIETLIKLNIPYKSTQTEGTISFKINSGKVTSQSYPP